MSNVTQNGLHVVTRVRVGADAFVRPASKASVQPPRDRTHLPRSPAVIIARCARNPRRGVRGSMSAHASSGAFAIPAVPNTLR
jgi:hypothetical protein